MPLEERRKFPRLSFNVYIDYQVLGRIDNVIFTAQGKDLSAGGIRTILFEKMNVGTLLKLTFLLPGYDRILNATGKVVWLEEISQDTQESKKTYDTGIEFVYIEDTDKKRIKEYVIRRG